MLNSFLDKKSLQEITNIFKQHVQHQYSSKEKFAGISVIQQDKINRFLNCYQQYFSEYLLNDNTYQHFDYYRILSKYIKVFNLEKGQKFKRNNYDGLYIILKGFIQEIIVQEEQPPQEQANNNPKTTKRKTKQQDQIKMSKIVNMVMGINRMKGSSNDISQRESVQIMPSIHNFLEESSNQDTPNSEINPYSQTGGITNQISQFNAQKQQQNEVKNIGSSLTVTGVNRYEYLPNSPEPQHTQGKSLLQLDQLTDKKKGFEQNNDFQQSMNNNFGEIVENNSKNVHLNSPQIEITKDQNSTSQKNKISIKDLKLIINKNNLQTYERGDTDAIEKEERLDDVHELTAIHTPQKSPFYLNNERKQFPQFVNSTSQTASNSHQNSASPQKQIDNSQNKQSSVELFQINLQNVNKANNQLKKKLSFMIAMQPKATTPFPEYANKPYKLLSSGDIIDLIKINESQRKYFVQEIEDSICLYIGKKSMEKAFKEQIIQLRYKTAVLEKFFNNVPSNKILKLAYHFYEKTLFKNQIVYKQGDPRPHYIYIIKSGEVQISESTKTQQIMSNVKLELEDSSQKDNSQEKPDQIQSDQEMLQKLCRKKLQEKQLGQSSYKSVAMEQSQQSKILCQLGEEEIFGIEEVILQKENRDFQAVVTSSQAEFYVIPEDLFENFRQTESDSILSWFKQKEIFYSQQRNMHKRIKGGQNAPKSSNDQYFSKKKVQQACQYLFQEDEQTFNTRLDQLHNKKIIQLKNYHQYKQYITQKKQQISSSSQNSLQSGNDSQNINSPKVNNQSSDKNNQSNKEQNDNLSKFHPQNQLQLSQKLLLGKITQISQQNQPNQIEQQTSELETNFNKSRVQSAKPNYFDQLKKSLVINLIQADSKIYSPYMLTDRLANRSPNMNSVSPTSSVSTINLNGNDTNKSVMKTSVRLNFNQAQSTQKDNQMRRSQLLFKKVFSQSNLPNEPNQQSSPQILSINQEKNIEQYKVQTTKLDQNKINQPQQSNQGSAIKRVKKGITTESLCSIDQDQSQSFTKQNQQNEPPQSLLGPPASLEYISNNNLGQSSSGDILNLGRIHHMIKSNTKIMRQKLNLKGKNQLFKKPIFEELKQENIKQINKILKMRIPLIEEDKKKEQQPLSERWKNTAKSMQNFQKCQEFIKSSQSLNNNNYSPKANTQKEIPQSQSFINPQTPRSLHSFYPTSAKSFSQIDSNSSPSLNIHMENKRKLQRSNEPYFTRPFSRAEQRSQGGDSNFSSHSKHRTLHSSNLKRRQTSEENEISNPLQLQLKKRLEFRSINNYQTIITSQFSLTDRQPLTPRNQFENLC